MARADAASGRRSRRRRLTAGAACVIAAACVAWLLMRPLPASGVELALRVEGRRQITVAAGAPIALDIYLSAPRGASSIVVGSDAHPWFTRVRLVEATSGRPLGWSVVALGSPTTTVYSTRADGGPVVIDRYEATATVDASHVHHATVAVPPETIQAGVYRIAVVVDAERWPPWRAHGTLRSSAVTVTVAAGNASGRLETDRLESSTEFFILTGRGPDARRLAEAWTAREPSNPGAWVALGDALDVAGLPREAVNVYRHALALLPRTYEPPAALYERIERVTRKIRK
ncbi:MAG: tetratricopeptide repeat protein [Vicinamibacterales bacterium]